MKKKLKDGIAIFLTAILGIAIGISFSEGYKYTKSVEYLVKKYEHNASTENLMKLCVRCADNADMRYLEYVDELMQREDYEKYLLLANPTCKENDIETLKDVQMAFTLAIAVSNENLTAFLESLDRYYLEIDNAPFVLHEVMANIENSFISDNQEVIVAHLYDLAMQVEKTSEKAKALLNILAYYKVADPTNAAVEQLPKQIAEILYGPDYDPNVLQTYEHATDTYATYWKDFLNLV